MRSDARRNRERVLVAAEDVFSEMGLRAQIEEVARRAGVGVGTVCRHFPTKQALVEAVLEAMLRVVAGRRARGRWRSPIPAPRSTRSSTRSRNSRRAISRSAEHMATEIDLSASAQSGARRASGGDRRAGDARAGRGRNPADIGSADVALLFSGVAHATALAGDLQPMLRRRYVALILDGLRPLEASPLPGKPLDFQQFRKIKLKNERKSKPE